MATPSRGQKRVRFSDRPQVLEYEPAEDGHDDALEELEGEISAVRLDNTDPSMAAMERAKRRRDSPLEGFEADVQVCPDEDAEADYDHIPQSIRLGHAARLEPFHLRRERMEGHFDPETGSYVPHHVKRSDVEDAWADALLADEEEDGSEGDVDGDSEGEGSPSSDPEGFPDPDASEDRAMLRSTILSSLRPGETILAALRRIGRRRQEHTSQGSLRRAALTPEASAAFEQLTDAGAKLMRITGDFALYSRTREQIAKGPRKLLGQELLLGRPLRLPAPLERAAALSAEPELDMFAGDESGTGTVQLATREAPDAALPQAAAPSVCCGGMHPVGSSDQSALSTAVGIRDGDDRSRPALAACGAEAPCRPPGSSDGTRDMPDGFRPDPRTGFWVNTALGCTFDPVTRLFGDMGTGMQYLWHDGQYQPVGMA